MIAPNSNALFDTDLPKRLRDITPEPQIKTVHDAEFWARAQLAKKQIEQSSATVKPRLKKMNARNIEWCNWICKNVGGIS